MFGSINKGSLLLPALQYAFCYFASWIQLAIFIYTTRSDNRIIFWGGDDDDDHAHNNSLSEANIVVITENLPVQNFIIFNYHQDKMGFDFWDIL